MDKINTLSTGEKLIGGGGVLILIASLFDWWRLSSGGLSFGSNGWDSPGAIWSVLAILVSVGLAGAAVLPRLTTMTIPSLPENLTWGVVYGGGAVTVIVLMLLKAWRIVDFPVGGFGIGFFIAIVATGAIAYGGYLLYSEEKAGVARP